MGWTARGLGRRAVLVAAVMVAAAATLGASGQAPAPSLALACPLGMNGTAYPAPAGGVACTVCTGRVASFNGTPLDTDLTLPGSARGGAAADRDAARVGAVQNRFRGQRPGR
jgi:hypothetical protein